MKYGATTRLVVLSPNDVGERGGEGNDEGEEEPFEKVADRPYPRTLWDFHLVHSLHEQKLTRRDDVALEFLENRVLLRTRNPPAHVVIQFPLKVLRAAPTGRVTLFNFCIHWGELGKFTFVLFNLC